MEVLLSSTLLVAFAEIGDKTMLLAIVLAARLKRPWPIIWGILGATIFNHALAAWAGAAIAGLANGWWFRFAVAMGFLAMGAWTLIPDKIDDEASAATKGNAFLTTLVAFFLAEMGDKTQIATVALGARYQAIGLVAAGTTLGMMIANVPAVFMGEGITRLLPMRAIRFGAAAIFVALGLWALIELFQPD
jgi:putative Ca2+/H+ antiporter (TMEM165/GDT1 family)